MQKPETLLSALEGNLPGFDTDDIADDDLVLFVDAHDVFLVADAKEIAEKFLEISATATDGRRGMKFLYAGEKKCWPENLCESLASYPKSPSEYCCANTGFFLSRKVDMITTLKAWVAYFKREQRQHLDNDQVGAHVLVSKPEHKIAIDWNQNIAQIMHLSADHVTFNETSRRFYNTHTKTQPLLLHFNGGSKAWQVPLFQTFVRAVSSSLSSTDSSLPPFVDQQVYNTQIVSGTGLTISQICCGNLATGEFNKLRDDFCDAR